MNEDKYYRGDGDKLPIKSLNFNCDENLEIILPEISEIEERWEFDYKESNVAQSNLIESFNNLKCCGDFPDNQTFFNAEYKTKLLNIEQMGKKKINQPQPEEFNLYGNKEIDPCNHNIIKIDEDDEQERLNLFCLNDDLIYNKSSFTNLKDNKKHFEDQEYQESTSAALNNAEIKDVHPEVASSVDKIKNKMRDMNTIHDISNSQISKKRVIRDLHFRLDVVNKTFIRSIKRHYDDICSNKKRIKSAKNVSAVTEVCKCIDEICKTKFKDYFKQNEMQDSPSTSDLLSTKESKNRSRNDSPQYSDVKLLVACMVMPDVLKVYMKTKIRKATFTIFSNAIYKYSHKNMLKLMEHKTFNIILDQYVRSPDFEEMLKTDETLKRFPDMYREKGNTLIQLNMC